jgi:Zn finger protein HypA/HybF involved in hydrogenase expression
MYLPFKCEKCNHIFITIDEQEIHCPKCDSKDVLVDWEFFKEAIK